MERDFDKGAESYDLKPGRVNQVQNLAIAIISKVNLNQNMDVLIVQANGQI